jgi:hypothetical protein
VTINRIRCFMLQPTDAMAAPHVRVFANPEDHSIYVLGFIPIANVPVAPPGAMWFAAGFGLVIRTPGGDWMVDNGFVGGGEWIRTGKPPVITVEPAVLIGSYYGRLREGFLEECS